VFTLTVHAASPDSKLQRLAAIKLRPMRTGSPAAVDWVKFIVVDLALPYLCIALGFWVAAVRIHDRQAWLVLALLLSLAEFTGGSSRTLFGRDDAFQPVAVVYQVVFGNLWPATMMLFGPYFPDRLDLDRRMPWAKWLLIAPLLFRVLVTNPVLVVLQMHHRDAAISFDRLFAPMRTPVLVLHLAAMLVFFISMAYRTITVSQPDVRRRTLLLDAGAAVGVIPIVVAFILLFTDVIRYSIWIVTPLLASLFVFPLTMAYVIVVDRAMDVRVVVRQGVQYLLARSTLRVIQVALVTTLGIVAARTSAASDATIAGRIALVAAGVIAVVLIQIFAGRLRDAIDRRFFREAYNAEQILSELANQVRTMIETGPLVETVVNRISETLHVPNVAILLHGSARLQPTYALGYHPAPDVTLADDGQIVGRLRQGSHVRIEAHDRDSWVQDLPAGERQMLEEEVRARVEGARRLVEAAVDLLARDHGIRDV